MSLIEKLISVESLDVGIQPHPHAWGPKQTPLKEAKIYISVLLAFLAAKGPGATPPAPPAPPLIGRKPHPLLTSHPNQGCSIHLPPLQNREASGGLEVDKISHMRHLALTSPKKKTYAQMNESC